MKNIESQRVEELRPFRQRFTAGRCGYAFGRLTDVLFEALDTAGCEYRPWWECLDLSDLGRRWDDATPIERANWLLGQLWNCTDAVSFIYTALVDLQGTRSVAVVARKLKAELRTMATDADSGAS